MRSSVPLVRRLFGSRSRLIWWLLWLVPLAQSAALWHGLSHLGPADLRPGAILQKEAVDPDRGDAALGHHCGLCLVAASVCAALLAPVLALRRQAIGSHVRPRSALRSVWQAPLVPAYLSRGPPLARR